MGKERKNMNRKKNVKEMANGKCFKLRKVECSKFF